VWLDGHVAIQDRIPRHGYTLLRFKKHDVSALQRAMKAPFTVLDVPDAAARDLYGVDLILLRPDMHVAWRGNRPPADPQEVAARVTGHAHP
jgi:hypothetical protein